MLVKKIPAAHFYARATKDNHFTFQSLQRKRGDVIISRSDQIYGDVSIKRIAMRLVEDEAVADQAKNVIRAWVVQNPDETFWWDTLESIKAECQSWMGSSVDRLTTLGMKIVCVEFEVA